MPAPGSSVESGKIPEERGAVDIKVWKCLREGGRWLGRKIRPADRKRWKRLLCVAGWGLFMVVWPLYVVPGILEMSWKDNGEVRPDSALLKDKEVRRTLTGLRREIGRLERRLDVYLPHQPYIVINTTRNWFYLYTRRGKLIREGFCSSGSYTKLVSGKRSWLFKTPKGRMTVLSKVEHPVWTKPDWAFVEEGLPVPPPGDPSRYERGVLGDYALRMADGYLLHGTLYKRFLGMPVTHGCVRFGDEDLEVVYKTLPVGAYVYIY